MSSTPKSYFCVFGGIIHSKLIPVGQTIKYIGEDTSRAVNKMSKFYKAKRINIAPR